MAYAAYRDPFRSLASIPQPFASPAAPAWWQRPIAPNARRATAPVIVLPLTVDCQDAHAVRHLVTRCPGCGVLRCIPNLRGHRVRLELRVPLAMVEALMHEVIAAVDGGEFGPITSWEAQVLQHRLDHRVG